MQNSPSCIFKGEEMKILYDLHTHTNYSHGKDSPEANILRAIELGLNAVAISEHASGNMYYGVRGKKLARLNEKLRALKKEYSGVIDVLTGLECNVLDFGLSDTPKNRNDYDLIILGFHKGVPPTNAFARHILFESFGGKSTPRRNTDAIMEAASKARANIISHPNEYLRVDIPYMADCARELDIALEINSKHVSLTADEIRTIYDRGAKLIIGSDAHRAADVGNFKAAIATAAAAGVLDGIINISRD